MRWECDGNEMEMKFEDTRVEELRKIFGSEAYKKICSIRNEFEQTNIEI